jgi:putative transposase
MTTIDNKTTVNKTEVIETHKLDNEVLSKIKEIINKRPTYGYRRVTSVLNAQRQKDNLPPINHKRTYRIMKENSLLLSRFSSRPVRVHDGKIITLYSNTRWCSDAFYITCDNGERLQVAFSLDTCDREAMRYIASTGGINGEMIRDLIGYLHEIDHGIA